jgi:hypothetical protein
MHTQVDLTAASSSTLPFENLSNTKVLALNPAGTLLLSFDEARPACASRGAVTYCRRCWQCVSGVVI